MAGRRVCVCCCRVGDPHWQDQGGEQVARRCRRCAALVVVEVSALLAAQALSPGRWDVLCVECYSKARAPVEIWLGPPAGGEGGEA